MFFLTVTVARLEARVVIKIINVFQFVILLGLTHIIDNGGGTSLATIN